ncbi:LOW QUALITY PROTEIN: hypothetical protein HZS_4957 [Henneguya salminicola]|nr:LOW QUALITY PROTEIN: hypothetical protein HZS_4957 [Henneguya salminicola]
MEFNWMPKYIILDFELGMIRAINHEFPESRIIGCYFHFKPTINKKLQKFKISNQVVKIELITLVSINGMVINNYGNIFTQHGLIGSSLRCGIIEEPTIQLERYKRWVYDHFLNAHANICMIVKVITNEFEFYEQHCLEIRQNASNIRYNNKLFHLPLLMNSKIININYKNSFNYFKSYKNIKTSFRINTLIASELYRNYIK